MARPTGESCGTCHFGQPQGDKVQACHRNAPRPVQHVTTEPGGNGTHLVLRWPAVNASDWCGEYQAQRPKTER